MYAQGTLNGGSGKDALENNSRYGGENTKLTGGTQADPFRVGLDDGSYQHTQTKVTITDFHHSEGDKLDFRSEHLTGDSTYTATTPIIPATCSHLLRR